MKYYFISYVMHKTSGTYFRNLFVTAGAHFNVMAFEQYQGEKYNCDVVVIFYREVSKEEYEANQ